MLTIPCKMLEGCDDLLPVKAHSDDAAFDLKSRVELVIAPSETKAVPTGLHLALPVNYEAQVRPRSGLALKKSITVLNTPGTIDAGYRGEVCAIIINHGKEPFEIHRGDRIAQMVIQQLPEVSLQPVNELSETERGNGGFGSTGR